MRNLLLVPLLLSTGCAMTVRSRPPMTIETPRPVIVETPRPVIVEAPRPTPPVVVVEAPRPIYRGEPVYRPAPPPPAVHPSGPVYGTPRPKPVETRDISIHEARRIALDYADRRGFFDARVKDVDSRKDEWKVELELPGKRGKIKLGIDRCTGAIVRVDENLKNRKDDRRYARLDD